MQQTEHFKPEDFLLIFRLRTEFLFESTKNSIIYHFKESREEVKEERKWKKKNSAKASEFLWH